MNAVLIQFFSVFFLSFGNFLASVAIAWCSVALEVLESDDSPVGKITKFESYLVGALPMLGTAISIMYTGWMSDTIGRKKTQVLTALCFTLSWAIVATARNIHLILLGRVLLGIANGMHPIVSWTYLSELSQESVRGTFTSMLAFSYCSGNLVSYVAGWFFSYKVVCYGFLSICVVFVLLVCCLKETPAYLISRGKEKEALESLQFYRGVSKPTQDLLVELEYIRNQNSRQVITTETDVEKSEKEKLQEDKTKQEPEVTAWQILRTSKSNQRALITITLLVILLVFCGTVAVTAYAGQLFAKAAPSLSSHLCSVLLAVSFAVGSLIGVAIGDSVGRRPLMIVSSCLSAVFLVILASQVRWSWAPDWLTPVAVLSFCCVNQSGVAIVPFMQMSESFVPKIMSLVTTVIFIFMSLANFLVLGLFGPAVEYLGLDGTFFMFSIICAAAALISFLIMKETKGVPTETIQEMYAKGYLYRKSQRIC